MKKREQGLLQILVCMAIFAFVWILFLDPVLAKREELKVQYDVAQTQKDNMDRLLQAEDLMDKKEAQVEKAQKNYEFFYGVLNTYSIDEILNGLAAQHGLSIQSLQIGEYEEATDDFITVEDQDNEIEDTTDTTEEEQKTESEMIESKDQARLLKSAAEISVTGSYDNILAFVDAMNAKSSCLKTTSLSIYENSQDASGSHGNTAQIQVAVYGINTIEEK